MAAAARRAWWARTEANLVDQSGRIRSVVMTLGALADKLCPLLRPVSGVWLGEAAECSELCEDIGDLVDDDAKFVDEVE